jgi:hypothetical protein
LSAERGATIQRRQEIAARQRLKQVEYDDVHAQRFAVSKEWFISNHEKDVVEARGDIDSSTLLAWIPVGSNSDELRPVAEAFVSSIRTAFSEIESAFTGTTMPPSTSDELKATGLTIPEGHNHIYELVAEHIGDERRAGSETHARTMGFTSPLSLGNITFPEPYIPTPDIVYQRQDARIEQERQLDSELRALSGELELLDEQLRKFKRPEGIRDAVIALTYLALVGIVLPTILMAVRPVPDGPVIRIIVVVGFVSGLGVLLGYFLLRARALRQRFTLFYLVFWCCR